MQGLEGAAIQEVTAVTIECANRVVSQTMRTRAEKTFRKQYPQGEEVAEWLLANKLAHFTSTFDGLELNTLRKISTMTTEDVHKVHRTFLLQNPDLTLGHSVETANLGDERREKSVLVSPGGGWTVLQIHFNQRV